MAARRCSTFFIALLVASVRLGCVASGDLYEVFGLTREASQADIKRTYKKLALQFHPDKNTSPDAEQRFIAIQKAYEVLSDSDKRQRYDARRGFFHSTDADDGSGSSAHPPDFGKGIIFESPSDFWQAVNGDDLWVVHVYSDQHENFGSWMAQLADEIKLGHLNVDRGREFNDVLQDVLGSRRGQVPLLVLCQRGRYHPFKPSFQSVFFGLHSTVAREALNFVDYWQDIARLSSDVDLRHFLTFRPGGSSRLRFVVICERLQERRFGAYVASSRLKGHLQVAQLGYYDATDLNGRPGQMLGTFGIRHLPAGVLFDPGTGRLDVVSGDRLVEGMPDAVGKILDGRPRASQIFAIQEFDAAAYHRRCGADGATCGWLLLLATPSGLEKEKERLNEVLEAFGKTCRLLLSASYRLPNAACFWLRRGRVPAWDALLRRMDSERRGTSEVLSAAVGPRQIAVAPNVGGSSQALFSWFKSVAAGEKPASPLERSDWPPLPSPLSTSEEPVEEMEWEDIFRKVEAAGWSAADSAFQGIEHLLMVLERMDGEELAIIMGILILCVAALIALCACSGGQQSEESEIEALAGLEKPWVAARLKREEGQKFGIGIEPLKDGEGLGISKVHEGGALDLWNRSQQRIERRIQSGDRICCASHLVQGRRMQCASGASLAQALREATEVTLMAVLEPADGRPLRRIAGTVILDDLLLRDCLKLATRPDGQGTELEVVRIEPALAARNAVMHAERACCTQRIDVGDLIVAVNGHVRLSDEDLREKSPAVLVAKWRLAAAVKAEAFEVAVGRASPDDRWGVQLRLRAEDQRQMEVRRVVAGGAIARWNDSDSRSGRPKVLAGDRLVAANGQQGLDEIAVELKGMQVVLTFERWVDSSPVPGCTCSPADGGCMCGKEGGDDSVVGTSPTPMHEAPSLAAVGDGEETAERDGWDLDFDVGDDAAVDDVCIPKDSAAQQPSQPAETDVPLPPDASAADGGGRASINAVAAGRRTPSMTAHGSSPVAPPPSVPAVLFDAQPPRSAGEPARSRHQHSPEPVPTASVLPRAPPGVGDLWGLPDSGGEWLRSARGFLCVLAGPGSPRYLADLAELRLVFRAASCPVHFFYEARLPPDSVLVAFPRAGRSALLTPGQYIDKGTCVAVRDLLWRSLSGDVLGLPDIFDATALDRYCNR